MKRQGILVKAIAGFYYVFVAGFGIYECRGRGILRKEQVRPMVGDHVTVDVVSETEMEGALAEVAPRGNRLIRPPVSNVDQALVVVAMANPNPSRLLLDTFLASLEHLHIPAVICLNKADLGSAEDLEHYAAVYGSCGYPVFRTNASTGEGIPELMEALRGKTTVFAGTSGVGKSTLANRMQSAVRMETGEISRKLLRGKNTTRHCELLVLEKGGFLVDAPGFSSFELQNIPSDELAGCFPEFRPYTGNCYYRTCVHDAEPDCAVKKAVEEGTIDRERYENYRILLDKRRDAEKHRYG